MWMTESRRDKEVFLRMHLLQFIVSLLVLATSAFCRRAAPIETLISKSHPQRNQSITVLFPCYFHRLHLSHLFFLSTNEYNVRGRLEVSGCTCTLQSGFRPQHQEKKKKKNCSTSIYLLPNQDKENISNLLQSPILPLLKARRHPKLSSCFRC